MLAASQQTRANNLLVLTDQQEMHEWRNYQSENLP